MTRPSFRQLFQRSRDCLWKSTETESEDEDVTPEVLTNVRMVSRPPKNISGTEIELDTNQRLGL